MERCPNCGEPSRPGAKFCTSCRFQFPLAEGGNAAEAAEGPDGPEETEGNAAAGSNAAELNAGWPTAPGKDVYATWEVAAMATGGLAESSENPEQRVWPAVSSGSASAIGTEEVHALNEGAPGDGEGFWPSFEPQQERSEAPRATDQPEPVPPVARAELLLDELKRLISELGRSSQPDLSSVISDLEVAVTPPGALAEDDLAELREALLRARERPRDLDTVIDLSQRIDGVVALIFAYDRASAAIERALAVLRPEPLSSSEAEDSPPATPGDGQE
jgi:hypothetical protein